MGLLLALACSAALLQSAQAVGAGTLDTPKSPSCDITDLNCISQEFKASLNVTQGTIESEYQQFAEMIAPVLLMAHGGSFEVCLSCLLLASGDVCAVGAYRHSCALVLLSRPLGLREFCAAFLRAASIYPML